MKIVMVVWNSGTAEQFENNVPLVFVGQRYQKLRYQHEMHLLLIDGLERWPSTYQQQLIDLGYILHDAGELYNQLANDYVALDRFGAYEKKCFLRWLVIDRYFPQEPIMHVDGDIVFNEDPQVITQLVQGLTFVLQGCPAFTVIHDRTWFRQYGTALNEFVADIDNYSAQAWQEREGWLTTFRTRWAGSRFRQVITSDQDLISHLLHTGRLMQEPIENVMLRLEAYIYFENPLFIHMYDDNFPYRYARLDDVDFFLATRVDGQPVPIKKRVLFWHMQSSFVFYLSKFMLRRKLWFVANSYLPMNVRLSGYEEHVNRWLQRYVKHTSRRAVYRYFFEKHTFSGIFRSYVWWKKGIFESR